MPRTSAISLDDIGLMLEQFGPEAIDQAALAAECERSLLTFTKTFWHVVEPGRQMVSGWTIDAICDHLEAVTAGEITRLLINVPPGFMKSLLTNVFFPAWQWGPKNMPTMRFAAASYSQSLTNRDNIRFRRVVTSPEYTRLWGHRFSPAQDQFNIVRVGNNKTGWKLATSLGGLGTGERADCWVIDDANNVLEAESEAVVTSTNMWLREVLPDRLNDQTKSAIINIQQRTAENDASGTLLDMWGSECVHLMIPMEYDSGRHCSTSIGWEDPRTVDGELAWPERFPQKAVEALRHEKGPYAFAGQYQQAPAPRGGGIIKTDWWKLWPAIGYEEYAEAGRRGEPGYRPARFPDFEFLCTSVDTAYTEKEENDWCACTTWGVWRDRARLPRLMLVEAWKEHLEMHALVRRIIETCQRRKVDACLIEAKANGLSVIQEIKRLTREGLFHVYPIDPDGDKVARMHSVVPLFSGGLIFAPDRAYAQMVIDDVSNFPKGKSRDIADTVSQALRWLRKTGMAKLNSEAEDEEYQSLVFRGQSSQPAQLYDV
jgi:predicted phage terminase large subunit-like protein